MRNGSRRCRRAAIRALAFRDTDGRYSSAQQSVQWFPPTARVPAARSAAVAALRQLEAKLLYVHLGLHSSEAGPRCGTPRASLRPPGAPGGDIPVKPEVFLTPSLAPATVYHTLTPTPPDTVWRFRVSVCSSTQKPEISKRCQAVSGGVGVSRVKFKDEGGAGEPASANRGRALDLQTKCFPWLRESVTRSF